MTLHRLVSVAHLVETTQWISSQQPQCPTDIFLDITLLKYNFGNKISSDAIHIPEESDISPTAKVNPKKCTKFVAYNLKNHKIKSSFCGTNGLNKLKTMH
jgi:hypothetical protein